MSTYVLQTFLPCFQMLQNTVEFFRARVFFENERKTCPKVQHSYPMAGIEAFYAMATTNYFKSITPCWCGNSNYTDWQRLP